MPNKKVSQNVRPNALIYEDRGDCSPAFFDFLGLFVSDLSLHPLVLLLVGAVGGSQLCFKPAARKKSVRVSENIASNTRKFDYLFHTMIDFRFAKEVRINRVSRWLSGKFEEVLSQYAGSYAGFQRRQWFLQCRRLPNRVLSDGCHVWLCGAAGSPGSDQYRRFQCVSGRYIQFFGVLWIFFARLSHLLYLSKYAEDYQSYTALARPVHLDKGE